LLQDRRMEKFEELLKRWHDGELSGAEAGEFLGCSERQFRMGSRRQPTGDRQTIEKSGPRGRARRGRTSRAPRTVANIASHLKVDTLRTTLRMVKTPWRSFLPVYTRWLLAAILTRWVTVEKIDT
jgi:hypothetical protein